MKPSVELAKERLCGSKRAVAGLGETDGERQNMRRIEAWLDVHQSIETPHRKAGARQQDQRERDFGTYQHIPDRAAAAGASGSAT